MSAERSSLSARKTENMKTINPNTINVRRVLLAAVLCAAAAVGQHAAALDADSLLQRIQERYDSTKNFTADFEQETEYRTLNRTIRGKGKVYFSKPGKMLWLYDEPDEQFVLADGTHLYFYQPAEKQIIKTALGTAFRSDLPLSFLLGLGEIRKYFRPGAVAESDEDIQIELHPKETETGLERLRLTVTPENYDIKRVLLEDTAGNRWTIHFRNIEHSSELQPSVFELRAPQGVDIVEFGS